MLRNPDPEGYMCDRLLDMMEDVPFHKIKVTEFCRFANVSRSAFYAHFDSIYDVIQKIEDDYFAGMPGEGEFVFSQIAGSSDSQVVAELMRITGEYANAHLREFRILSGENGEPSFRYRLARRVRAIASKLIDDSGMVMEPTQRDLLVEFTVGSQIAAAHWMSTHADEVDADAIAMFSVDVVLAAFEGVLSRNHARLTEASS